MKKTFFSGLAILLPLTITILVVGWLIHLLTNPFIHVVSNVLERFHILRDGLFFLKHDQAVRYISQFLILVSLFAATLLLGALTRWFLVRTLMNWSDHVLHRLPLIGTVYKTTQEFVKTLLSSDRKSFKQVVMVPFPQKDMYVLGLVSRDAPKICCEKTGEDLISVLVPTTPNPTTGFLMMYKKKDLILIDMKPEDAIKYIVSCGVIIPSVDQK